MVGGDSGGVKELEPGQAVIFERRGKSYVHWCPCAPHGAKIELFSPLIPSDISAKTIAPYQGKFRD